ncbi:uncharacterized protein LOC128386915 [Panonychus citri]|uniref:uncharacterized protein LOC128386915 n=1 Tax=Panonychus citri TaxID=50023 RepID=UPI0023082A59|nr:uncharacterized protein LOC128386915 [Panonychus citri]
MDCPFQIPESLSKVNDYQNLLTQLQNAIENIESYRDKLLDKSKELTISLDHLAFDGSSIVITREIDVIKGKVTIVDKTLSSLSVLQKYSEEASDLHESMLQRPNYLMLNSKFFRLSVLGFEFYTFIEMIISFIKRSVQPSAISMNSLDSGHKSPYDFSSIIDKLLKSLENNSNPDSQIQVESLLKLAQSELQFIRQSKDMNEGQLTLIKIYCDKLNLLDDELSSIDKETENKPKQKAKKLRDIVNGTRLIIKETFELIVALKTVEWINESDEIFVVINEKGADSFDDVIDYMEKIKKHWIERKTVNETSKVCRLAALRRFNVYIKQMKKLSILKSELESDWIILGIKNIITNFNRIERSSSRIVNNAYYLTYKGLPKPPVDVPVGFIRDDIIYKDLDENSHQHLIIVLIYLIRYLDYLNSLTWNKFQDRKPRRVCDNFVDMIYVFKALVDSDLDDSELKSISFDLADRLCLAKIKISNDRDALEYRLFRYKPRKPFKFVELQKIFNRNHPSKRYPVMKYIENNLDEIINGFNRKVTNRGQMMIMKSAMEMMKRSLKTLKLMRTDFNLDPQEKYLGNYLVNQSANEFCYVAETLGTLLDNFRPNRRTPFSFNADGKFTQQINEIGLGMKKDFEMEINSQIEKLKATIKENEENLESTKEEKIQLRYLTSIVKRSILIPIKEIELSEKDEIEILREIIEEYEYTLILYGPID